VTINQTREHGRPAKIDYPGALRNLHPVDGPNVRDPITLNQDHLIGQIRSRLRVEQAASANGNALGGAGLQIHC
jgi:hypothetical protein